MGSAQIIASEALIEKMVVAVPCLSALNLVDNVSLCDLDVVTFGALSSAKQGYAAWKTRPVIRCNCRL